MCFIFIWKAVSVIHIETHRQLFNVLSYRYHVSSLNTLTYTSSSSNAQVSKWTSIYARNKSSFEGFTPETTFLFQLLFVRAGKVYKHKKISSNLTLNLLILPLQTPDSNNPKINYCKLLPEQHLK